MLEISVISAFIGGLLTFLAPCTLPMIPAYLSYISGTSDSVLTKNGGIRSFRLHILIRAALFVGGFTSVFVLFGMATGEVGKFFILYRAPLARICGALIVLFGLSMIGIIRLPKFSTFTGFRMPRWINPESPSGAYLLGAFFGTGWTPCLGPILGTILALSGASGTWMKGGFLLLVYAMGIAVPFLLVALIFGSSFSYLARVGKYLQYVKIFGAFLLILIGGLMVIGQFGVLNSLGAGLLSRFGYDNLMDYM